MSFTSYAQNFEDVMLWRAFSGIARGLYIDIGAQDPKVDSVSLLFHEHGWRGIHVEPTPHYAELLRQQRQGDTVIQAAVGNEQVVLKFFEIPGTGISTADATIAAQHRERGFDVHEIVVPCIPLWSVLDTVADNEVHWLKIDVEGFEAKVLSGWGKSVVRPWIVVVESILPLSRIETHHEWESTLLSYGYSRAYFDGVNRFYVSDAHPELKAAFEIPPNIFDRFALNGTASATFHERIQARCDEKVDAARAQLREVEEATSGEISRLTADLASTRRALTEGEHKRVQREQATSQQLMAEQAEVRRLLEDGAKRERVLSEQAGFAHEQLENVLRTLAQREHELGAQLSEKDKHAAKDRAEQTERIGNLLQKWAEREQEIRTQIQDLQQRALREIAEQSREHGMQVRSLERHLEESEEKLRASLDAANTAVRSLQRCQFLREREHSVEVSRSHAALQDELRRQVEREKGVALQLLDIQREVAREKERQAERHAEEVETLRRAQITRAESYDLQLQSAQQTIRELTSNSAIAQRQFDEQLRVELETRRHLQHLIESFETELQQMRDTISWRLTAPLRVLARYSGKRAGFKTASNGGRANTPATQVESPVSTPFFEDGPQTEASNSSLCESTSMKSDTLSVTTPLPRSSASENFKVLLQCQDYQFVEAAYLTLLKRKPDSDGGRYYLSRLRAGVPKIQILGQLYKSEEARMMGVQLPGLQRALKWQKLGQVPVLGAAVRIFASIERNSQSDVRMRAIEQQIYLLARESEARFALLERGIGDVRNAIEVALLANQPVHAQSQHSASRSEPRSEPGVESASQFKSQAPSVLSKSIVLSAGAPADVIAQLADVLANSREAQLLAERC